MTEVRSQPPSVASLASDLATPDPVAAKPVHRVIVSRPPFRERTFLAVAFLLLPAFAASVLALGYGVNKLVEAMRAERSARAYQAREALPPDAVLIDEQGWRREVATRPLAAPRLHLARCRLLAAAGRWAELDATVVSVALVSPGDLLPETRLLRARALAALSRPGEAAGVLHAIDGRSLDDTGRAQAAELAGRLWTAMAPDHRPR